MIGQRLNQFLIEEQIGAGGMGIVYRAHDETLNRAVAIKVLPPGAIADPAARDRFRQEASLLARVNHPNIATIHDFGRTDHVDYLVMEFISGQGLDGMISAGPMLEETIRALGQQLCSGLEAAHQLGIVHRDLKPANLRVTPDERLKILDFGLAKLLSAEMASNTAVTQAAIELTGLAGTLPYMAPEQVSGGVVDARTDIHAAGAVLYEMATGRAPFFNAVEPVALIGAILSMPPANPTSLNPQLSRGLERTILTCLEKDPARRYRSGRELALDLQPAARPMLLGSAPNSVAVLPFDNLSHDPAIDYLRLALAETVATTLGRARSISVRPLASTRKYSSDADLHEVGQSLRVRVLITGAFAAQPGAMRVSVEATDADDLRIIWSDTFTVGADLLVVGAAEELRARVARDLVSAMGVGAAVRSTGSLAPPHREGYELYLRSVAIGLDDDANNEAIRVLERSVSLDPAYAPSWAQLGRRYYIAGSYAQGGSAAYRKSEDAFQRALALDPESTDAAVGLAAHLTEKGDLRAAYTVAARLLERRPDAAAGKLALGYVYRFAGLHQLSAEYARAALASDRDTALGSFALTFLAMEDYAGALQFLALRAGTSWADNILMQTLLHQGDHADAQLVAERLASDPSWPAGFVLAFLQQRPATEITSIAEEYVQQNLRVSRDPESSYLDGALLVFCGLHEQGLTLLDQAVRGGYAAYPNLEIDPLLEGIRTHPMYGALVLAGRAVQQSFIDYLRGSGRAPETWRS